MAQPMYQLKIKLADDRYGVTFVSPNEIDKFDYTTLIERIRSISKRYSYLQPEQLRVQYCDDEKCFVDLAPNDPCALVKMFRCASLVENTDFKRVTIKVEEANSPAFSPPAKLKRQHHEQRSSHASRSLTTEFALSTEMPTTPVLSQASTSLQLNAKCDGLGAKSLFKSPLEKYIETLKHNLLEAKNKEKRVSEWLQERRSFENKKKSEREGPMCSNCHRREGHNRLNCPYEKCDSFVHCGDSSKHPEAKSEVKDVERQQKALLRSISEIQKDLQLKEASVASIENRDIYRVKKYLIDSDPAKYLNVGPDGTQVENWFQLNKDAKKLENILKGKLPPPGFDIQTAVNELDPTLNNSVINSGKTSVGNPYRKLWQDQGVVWPTRLTSSTSTTTRNTHESSQSEDFMLAMGIQKSLSDI